MYDDGLLDIWSDVCMRMDGCIRMDVCIRMYGWTDVCMYDLD